MCRKDSDGKVAVDPPLGWVLSEATRKGLDRLVCRCGNREQLERLESATDATLGIGKLCEEFKSKAPAPP